MTTEDECRNAAIKRYRIAAAIIGLLSSAPLIIATIAVIAYPGSTDGVPYYIGGFIAGFLGHVQALLCSGLGTRGQNSQQDVIKKEEFASLIKGHYFASPFLTVGCFAGIVLTGFELSFIQFHPANPDVPDQDVVQGLAIAIMVLSAIVLVMHSLPMRTTYTYGRYFGVRFGRVLIIRQLNYNTFSTFTNDADENNAIISTTEEGINNIGTPNADIEALHNENMLLQEQLRLQQELNQQWNQPFGFQVQPPINDHHHQHQHHHRQHHHHHNNHHHHHHNNHHPHHHNHQPPPLYRISTPGYQSALPPSYL